jgi:signal peptidase II
LAQDTFMGGAVVDFVDLQWWPVFNVADAAIVCGGIALVIFGSREPKAEPPADAERPSAGGPTSA